MLTKKKPANISVMIAVFCLAFLAFCAFACDMAYVTLYRQKLQRATETTALISVAHYKNTQEDKTQEFLKFFTANQGDFQNAHVEEHVFDKTSDDLGYKLKLKTSMLAPTYFLRFASVASVKIEATSYAQTKSELYENKNLEELITINGFITDKEGEEFTIKTNQNQGYFIFVGTGENENNIKWEDASCKSDAEVVEKEISSKKIGLICAQEAKFDFSKACTRNENINVAKYIKLYGAKVEDCEGSSVEEGTPTTFNLTVLNNVKLITSSDFLR